MPAQWQQTKKNRNLFPFRINDPNYDLSCDFNFSLKGNYSLQRECLKKPWMNIYNLIISRKKGIKNIHINKIL